MLICLTMINLPFGRSMAIGNPNSDGQNQANRGQTKPSESWWIWTKPNEPGKTGKTGQNRANRAKNGNFHAKTGKTGQKMGQIGQNRSKNGQKLSKNGRTKPHPGKTGQNRKFRRILVRVRSSLNPNGLCQMALNTVLANFQAYWWPKDHQYNRPISLQTIIFSMQVHSLQRGHLQMMHQRTNEAAHQRRRQRTNAGGNAPTQEATFKANMSKGGDEPSNRTWPDRQYRT